METDWAAENLQVIRTLMERGAVYRRALAPVTGLVGLTGIIAAGAAAPLGINSASAFSAYWIGVAVLCLGEAFLLVRRQAMKDHEPLWSPPMRRVTQALLPAFVAGCALGLLLPTRESEGLIWALIPAWMVLFGCGIHAAGFFVPRGFKLFGWGFVVGGFVVGVWALRSGIEPSTAAANWAMGAIFGGGNLAYSVYLYFTEQRRNAP